MTGLIQDLIRPYWSWLVIVFLAMLVETAMNLAGPWPLKIVLDNAVGTIRFRSGSLACSARSGRPHHDARRGGCGRSCSSQLWLHRGYVDNYYTESVGQWVANDLRLRVYHHLDRLSLAYYDTQQTGNL